jgi:hypothetical protein
MKASRTSSLTKWLRQHLVEEHTRPPRVAVPAPPRARRAGAASPPRARLHLSWWGWWHILRLGGWGRRHLLGLSGPRFLDGSLDNAMRVLEEEEALGFTSW